VVWLFMIPLAAIVACVAWNQGRLYGLRRGAEIAMTIDYPHIITTEVEPGRFHVHIPIKPEREG
jgi:hypothetical protein